MSTEINIQFPKAEQAISKLKGSSMALKTSMPTSVADRQALDAANKLDQLNQMLNKVIKSYQQVLLNHEATAYQMVQALRDTDEKASQAFQKGQRLP
ncbi:DUF5344 family protein [Camelliibacillus cellulosilyticus]|uniref:DUF5344 family protein n=1 Tax=Camelliibacillus cellulosilyticus TaxID=2174486 RepID=A0ABV9GST5_9BACL